MPDLFGNEDRIETSSARATAVSLFEHAAEHIAVDSGRNVAQVKTELVFGTIGHEIQSCVTCGSRFLAKPRTPSTCNLCRRVPA